MITDVPWLANWLINWKQPDCFGLLIGAHQYSVDIERRPLIKKRLRQAWTDHTFFFSGRFFLVWAYLVDVIWHKKSLKKEKINGVKIGTATAHFLPKKKTP